MTQEAEIAQLKKQLSEVVEQLSKAQGRESQLLAQLSTMQAENQALQEQLAAAYKRIEELEKQKAPPPPFVKANVKKPSKSARSAIPSTIMDASAKPQRRSLSIGSSTVRCARTRWEGSAWHVGAK